MNLAIVGCLHFEDYDLLCEEVEKLDLELTTIVSGGAKGADTLGRRYAEEHDLEMIEHLPEWKKYGRAAGPVRNKLIVEDADAVIAFYDGEEKGTKSTIGITEKAGKQLIIVDID